MENTGSFYAIMANGGATIRSSATDLSGQTAEYIVAYDGTNDKFAFAYGHAQDDPVAFGSELIIDGNMETNPTVNWADIRSPIKTAVADERTGGVGSQSINVLSTNTYNGVYQDFATTVGALYKWVGWRKQITGTAGGLLIFSPSPTIIYESLNFSGTTWTQFEIYFTATGASSRISLYANRPGVVGDESRFDDQSVKQVSALGTDALQLRNQLASGGSSRNWASIELGFNPDKISKIEVFSGE